MDTRLGAFIMTYNRPAILLDTIEKLLSQSKPPEYILVVDNSPGEETERAVRSLNNRQVDYHRMGYNAGPAGAADVGLKRVADMGFDWVFWGDDDDPPPNRESIERVLCIIEKYELNPQDIGVMGMIGGRLNRRTGRTANFANKELQGLVDADQIPGNKLMIVNRAVPAKGVFPSPELFFGFEELDFCLKVKQAGFRVVIDGEAMFNGRKSRGLTDANYRWKGTSTLGDESKVWRHYYSTRNLLIILRKNGYFSAVLTVFLKSVAKSFYGFRFGLPYGTKNFRAQWAALLHFVFGVTGRRMDSK